MRHIVALLLFVFPAVAGADTMLEFKDGTRNVWSNIKKVGNQYCTVKEYVGDYCVNMADLKKPPYEVPAGTEATEYGINTGAVQNSDEASAINQRSVNEMNDHAAQRNREIDARAKAEQKQINRNRRDGKADWAQ